MPVYCFQLKSIFLIRLYRKLQALARGQYLQFKGFNRKVRAVHRIKAMRWHRCAFVHSYFVPPVLKQGAADPYASGIIRGGFCVPVERFRRMNRFIPRVQLHLQLYRQSQKITARAAASGKERIQVFVVQAITPAVVCRGAARLYPGAHHPIALPE